MKTLFTLLFIASLALGQGSGSALQFSDGASYVAVTTTIGFSAINSGTIMCWVKPGNDSYGCIISSWHDGDEIRQFPLEMVSDGSGNVRFGVTMVSGDNDILYIGRTAQLFPQDQWYHIAYTSQTGSGTYALYINGVAQATTTIAGTPRDFFFSNAMLPSDHVQIGAKSDHLGQHRGHITGTLDEVSIWNVVLSEAEIRHKMCEQLTGSESGLVAYYRMDEGVDNSCSGGQDICDISGNGNHGTKF